MRKRFALAASVLALVLVIAGGCASGAATTTADSGPTFPVSIVVDNNLQQLKGVTISISRESSGRKLLGPVDSGRKKTFQYDAGAGTYILTARTGTPTDPEIVSQRIQLNGAQTITWHLASNQVVEGQ